MVKHIKASEEETQVLDPITKSEVEKMIINHEKSEDGLFSTRLLKFLGIGYGIASPLFIWLVVSTFNLQAEISLLKMRADNTEKIIQKIEQLDKSINDLKIEVTKQAK